MNILAEPLDTGVTNLYIDIHLNIYFYHQQFGFIDTGMEYDKELNKYYGFVMSDKDKFGYNYSRYIVWSNI